MTDFKPRVVVGAPVAERAWILDDWFRCLRRQTLRPEGFCFVYSDSTDSTLDAIQRNEPYAAVKHTKLPFHPRLGPEGRNADPADPCRAKHFSVLRNQLRTLFMQTDGDVLLSLDTDVLLEDDTAIERLVSTLYGGHAQDPRASWAWDVVAGCTFLHPGGETSECYNAGWWVTTDPTFQQAWRRATANDVLVRHSPLCIDIPMAAYAARRHVVGLCKYTPHECGEDMGFAQSLARHGCRVGWCTDVKARHIWSEQALTVAV